MRIMPYPTLTYFIQLCLAQPCPALHYIRCHALLILPYPVPHCPFLPCPTTMHFHTLFYPTPASSTLPPPNLTQLYALT